MKVLALCLLALIGAAASVNLEDQLLLTIEDMFDAIDTEVTDGEISFQEMVKFYLQYQPDPNAPLELYEYDFCDGLNRTFTGDFNRDSYYECSAYFKLLDMSGRFDPFALIESIDNDDVITTFSLLDEDGNGQLSQAEWRGMSYYLRPLPFGVLFAGYRNFDGSGFFDDFMGGLGWFYLFSDIEDNQNAGEYFTQTQMRTLWVNNNFGYNSTADLLFRYFDKDGDGLVYYTDWLEVYDEIAVDLDGFGAVMYFHYFVYELDFQVYGPPPTGFVAANRHKRLH